jgi:ABC-type dipeptide/oligopeptide/nickel transport system permease subunit
MIGEPPTLDTHTTTALNLFGDGLRDLLDPKLRGVHGAGREA